MSSAKKLLEAAAGNAGGAGLDVAEVFNSQLYKGTVNAQVITNGIDLSGEGGMVWTKSRSNAANHVIVDTEQGIYNSLASNLTTAKRFVSTIWGFSSTGYNVMNDTSDAVFQNTTNVDGQYYASWTWRKAPKFFDVVTYTGNGASSRNINHNLGCTVGMVMVKKTSGTGYWHVLHRSGNAAKTLYLNRQDAEVNDTYAWNSTHATSAHFTVGAGLNGNGGTYVAYLFAHNDDDGGFGSDADQDIISCGSYTGNGAAAGPVITLGWEPQWILLKESSGSNDWFIVDVMRGIPAGVPDSLRTLNPNWDVAEGVEYAIDLKATGFQIKDNHQEINNNGDTYIYMAIRAPMITPPEAATEVFNVTQTNSSYTTRISNVGFAVDTQIATAPGQASNRWVVSRLTGVRTMGTFSTPGIRTNANDGTSPSTNYSLWWDNKGFSIPGEWANLNTIFYNWKRAKGYFDVVTYNGNGTAGHTVNHSLGVVPEMMWVKNREDSGYSSGWAVYHGDNTNYLLLNGGQQSYDDVSYWNDTSPTSSVFSLGTQSMTNKNNTKFIAYLFATLDGISKVGSFTGTGSLNNIDCGFTSGARFVIIKKTTSAGEWFVFDTARGITTASTDGVLQLQSNSVQYTEQVFSNQDMIRPYSSGFAMATGSSNQANENSQTYIFYAIA